jgi:hypothetical protein
MSARSIGEVLGTSPGKPPGMRRTGQPVRRGSRNRGEREETIWRPLGINRREARKYIAAMLQAAEFHDRRSKLAGKRNGDLGHVALEALRELFRFADWKTGRLEPAIATICDRIKRSRAAVVAALARLKAHGFLDWLRRTEPTDNVGAGPQVRQITNAYGFDLARLPKTARAFVKKAIGWGLPPPDCEVARREQDRAEVDAMLDTLNCEEQAMAIIVDDELAEAVAGVGRALDKSASSPGGQNPGHGE